MVKIRPRGMSIPDVVSFLKYLGTKITKDPAVFKSLKGNIPSILVVSLYIINQKLMIPRTHFYPEEYTVILKFLPEIPVLSLN